VPEEPDLLDRLDAGITRFESRWIGKGRLQAGLAGGLIALGLLSSLAMLELLIPAIGLGRVEQTLQNLIAAGRVAGGGSLGWFAAWTALDGSVGMILLVAGALMITGRERLGVGLGTLGLLLSLTTVDLVVFYFQQFRTIITASVQFILFLALVYYRGRYIPDAGHEVSYREAKRG
jgi:hypothetical protein